MKNEDITNALTSINTHITLAQKELLQLTLQIQMEGDSVRKPEIVMFDTNPSDVLLQDTIDAAQADQGRLRLGAMVSSGPQQALTDQLENVKDILKQSLEKNGQGHLLHLVDQVKPEDLVRTAKVLPTAALVSSGPTPVASGDIAHEALKDQRSLELLSGPDSIFVTHLTSTTIQDGRGSVDRGHVSLGRWKEDALWVPEHILKGWPSGFYQNRDSKSVQLLITTRDMSIVVDGLPSAHAQVHVLWWGKSGVFENVRNLSQLDRKRVYTRLEKFFTEDLVAQ